MLTDDTTKLTDPSSVDPNAPKKTAASQPLTNPTPGGGMSLAGAAPSPASATANINQAPAQSPAQTPAQGALASATQNTTDPMAFAQSYMGTAADPEGIAYGGLMPSGQLNGYDDNGNAVTRNASNDATTIGMTPEQLDAYWAAKGANVLTPNLTPTGQLGPTGGATYDPAAVEKNRQELAAIAPNDPDVARQLNATNSTSSSEHTARMVFSAKVGISSVNTGRRYLVTNARWACTAEMLCRAWR